MKRRLAEEARLLTPDGADNPDAPRLACQAAPAPYLDGKLDDATWSHAPVAPLTHWTTRQAAEKSPTRVHAATDGRFLYLAVAATGHGDALNTTIDGQDHVEIQLDMDRDYSSYYRIRVAADGKTDCACDGDPNWKSGHFAAVARTDRDWGAEIAIPLASLTGSDAWGEVWCFNAIRVVPGVAAGGWAAPTDGAPDPLAMGHLRMPRKPGPAK